MLPEFIAEGNVFPLLNAVAPSGNIFRYSNSQNVKAFNNQTPDGKLWQFFNDIRYLNNTDYFLDEIETQVDDVLLGLQRRKKPLNPI